MSIKSFIFYKLFFVIYLISRVLKLLVVVKNKTDDNIFSLNGIVLVPHQLLIVISGLLVKYNKKNVYFLTDKSRLGDLTTYLLKKYGIKYIRGSSSRGSLNAIKNIIKKVKEGHLVFITFDGPKGPKNHIKPGLKKMISKINSPVYTVNVKPKRKFRILLNTWDNLLIPIPFSKFTVKIFKIFDIDKTHKYFDRISKKL